MIFRFTLGFLTDEQGWLSYWDTCGCALLLALAEALEGFVHSLHKVITNLLDIKLKGLPFWISHISGCFSPYSWLFLHTIKLIKIIQRIFKRSLRVRISLRLLLVTFP
ncbi:hypothetical protein BRARA_D00759 [Brassica rapa]|uniref:Uncharacterized protein n=1 Tax=Brassica campestris TaxID=3711 RepID=A0A397ZSE8_BRACM|nr:hypothetical protein BRARA_D00759 [Brassica rapa]